MYKGKLQIAIFQFSLDIFLRILCKKNIWSEFVKKIEGAAFHLFIIAD